MFAKHNFSKEESYKKATKDVGNGDSIVRAAMNYNVYRSELSRKVIAVIN